MNIIGMLPTVLGYVAAILGLLILGKWLLQLVQHISDEDYEEVRYVNREYKDKK